MKTEKQIKGRIYRMRRELAMLRQQIKENIIKHEHETIWGKSISRAEEALRQEIEQLRWVLK